MYTLEIKKKQYLSLILCETLPQIIPLITLTLTCMWYEDVHSPPLGGSQSLIYLHNARHGGGGDGEAIAPPLCTMLASKTTTTLNKKSHM
jgi:hypothetical protein